ncbi:MAG TPA: M23 family metallopeptidase [Sphingobacterium sp.]|nr:M23 family metallopeptidase [Sphingobacterium sp.]
MKYLNMVIFLLAISGLNAQEFNSVRKPKLLTQISTVTQPEISLKDTVFKEVKDTMFIPNTAPATNESAPTRKRINSIEFAKPLDRLQKTSSYGNRFHPILKKWRFHSGVDLAANSDTVYSILSGFIKDSGYSPTLGYYVRTEHLNGKIEVLYAHLSQYHYIKREPITAGSPLGITGSTGLSTGEHLHLAIYQNGLHVDPIAFMANILRFNYQKHIEDGQNQRKSNISAGSDIPTRFASYR